MNHEIRFRKTRDLADVVGKQLFRFFQNYLPSGPSPEVISARDAEFQLPNVLVKDIRMTAFNVSNQIQRCMLVINEYRGNLIKDVSESSFITNIFQMRDSLISKVIGDVLLPIVNLSKLSDDTRLDPEAQRRIESFLALLRNERSRLNTCLGYLLDYLNDSPNNDHNRADRQIERNN